MRHNASKVFTPMSAAAECRSENKAGLSTGSCANPILFTQKVGEAAHGNADPFVVIDRRPLIGQCFLASLRGAEPGLRFEGFLSMEAWQNAEAFSPASVVLLCLAGGNKPAVEQGQIAQELAALRARHPDVAVAVMSDCESVEQIVHVLKLGIRGYIPTSTSLEVAVQALELIKAGGIFMPATCMMDILAEVKTTFTRDVKDLPFSPRQLSVARALRKGTPNKIIAYDLNMCESTVKVHVREIMRKLKAKNRTEVAYLTNQYFSIE